MYEVSLARIRVRRLEKEELRKENSRLKTKLSLDNRGTRETKGGVDKDLAKEVEELRIEVSRLRLIEEEYKHSKEIIELGKKFKFKQKKGG